jgi:hypothetical protein
MLHLRWTAGDDFGGGDSLYAVMREYNTDAIVTGEDTFKPKLIGINEVPSLPSPPPPPSDFWAIFSDFLAILGRFSAIFEG